MLGKRDMSENNKNAINITLAEKIQLMSLIEATKGIMDMLFMTKEEYLKVVREPTELQQEIMNVLE